MQFTNNTFIDFGTLRIHEPVTALTDLLVAAVCYIAFFDLRKRDDQNDSVVLMKHYFLCFGLATSISGLIGHAFLQQLGFAWKLPGWIFSMLAATFGERAAFERASDYITEPMLRILKLINILKLIVFLVLTLYYMNFMVVGIHLLLGLLGIMFPAYYLHWRKTKNEGSKFMLMAIITVFASSLVFLLQVFIHDWFNHLDLSHVILAFAVVFFYMGTLEQVKPQPVTGQ